MTKLVASFDLEQGKQGSYRDAMTQMMKSKGIK